MRRSYHSWLLIYTAVAHTTWRQQHSGSGGKLSSRSGGREVKCTVLRAVCVETRQRIGTRCAVDGRTGRKGLGCQPMTAVRVGCVRTAKGSVCVSEPVCRHSPPCANPATRSPISASLQPRTAKAGGQRCQSHRCCPAATLRSTQAASKQSNCQSSSFAVRACDAVPETPAPASQWPHARAQLACMKDVAHAPGDLAICEQSESTRRSEHRASTTHTHHGLFVMMSVLKEW